MLAKFSKFYITDWFFIKVMFFERYKNFAQLDLLIKLIVIQVFNASDLEVQLIKWKLNCVTKNCGDGWQNSSKLLIPFWNSSKMILVINKLQKLLTSNCDSTNIDCKDGFVTFT